MRPKVRCCPHFWKLCKALFDSKHLEKGWNRGCWNFWFSFFQRNMSILANIGSCSKNIIIYFIGMTIRPRAFAILLNIVIDSIFSTRQNFINNNVLCFILIYSFGILIFMYIFGYFFSKRAFQGLFEKQTTSTKILRGREGNDDPIVLLALEGL